MASAGDAAGSKHRQRQRIEHLLEQYEGPDLVTAVAARLAAGVARPLVAEPFAGALEDAAFLGGGACLRGAAFFGIGTNSAMEGGGP